MIIYNLIQLISLQTLFLILIFETDVIIEYAKLFRLHKFFKLDDYAEKYKDNFELEYFDYLRQYHNCFFVRLITCPICLSFWLCLIGCLICGNIIDLPPIYLSSISLYYLFLKIS